MKRLYEPVFAWFQKEHPKLAAAAEGNGDADPAAWAKLLRTVPWEKGDAGRGEALFRAAPAQPVTPARRDSDRI